MVGRRLAPLTVKLLRDLWRMRSQALAIALVMAAGVGMVIMSYGMIRSLEATRADYYERYALADIWAPLRRAPDSELAAIAALPGVGVAESRITAAGTLDVPGIAEPVSARIHSLPRHLDRLVLRSGRLPRADRVDEAVVSEAFALAARLSPGNRIAALVHGKRIVLTITGIVLSPEYVYAVAPGQIFPDNRRFGVLWMAREPLGGALDLKDGFNEVLVRKAPGSRSSDVIAGLDRRLVPYGGIGAYGRDLLVSDRFLSDEIRQLRTIVGILPPIFLGVAAFLLNILLARLVDTERDVIGLLKAFGYRSGAIMRHYATLAMLLSVGGLVLGALLGTWLGRELAGLYQQYYRFPFLHFVAGMDVYLIAAGFAMLAVIAGAAAAVWRAQRLTPAEAMRPPSPASYGGGRLAEAVVRLVPDEPSRMVLRGLLRRPLRSIAAILGIASALALFVASASSNDNIERMIQLAFERGQRADMTVVFAEARDARVRRELEAMVGVRRLELFRTVAVRVSYGPRESRESILGIPADPQIARMVDIEGRLVRPPAQGVILSGALARKLGVVAGDSVGVTVTEGERQRFRLAVVAIADTPLGGSLAMERGALNRLLREGDVASGAQLQVDAMRRNALMAELKRTPMVAAVTLQQAAVRGIRDTVQESMGITTLFNMGFAMLLVVGVIYTGARISLSERARDIASMRVLGFRKSEARFVLLGEQALLTMLALPLGLWLGIELSHFIVSRFSGDLFTIPSAVSAQTLGKGVVVVAIAAIGTAWFIRVSADRLDLVRALKTRE